MKNPAGLALRLLTHNLGWKLLSLLLALAIWALVASEPELSTFATARVNFQNLPDTLELGSPPITSIVLELRGPADELGGMGDGNQHPLIILDMSGVTPGDHTFPIGSSNVRVPRGVRVVRITPSEVRFRFERSLQRTVPVKVTFVNQGQGGYRVSRVSADPPQLEIAGPQSHVERINSVETDPVDVASATGTTSVRVNAYLEDSYVRFQSSSQVTVNFTMVKQ